MREVINKKKKRKGFTLIELVIVLAVLAIIALIAIPNFTKVRNNSLIDGDRRSAEQIEKITLMALANQDIKTKVGAYKLQFTNNKLSVTGGPQGVTSGETTAYADLLRDVKAPQVPGAAAVGYNVEITADGVVGVSYASPVSFGDGSLYELAGTVKEFKPNPPAGLGGQ